MSNSDKKPPIQTIRNGGINVKLWEQQGKDAPFVTVNISKTYKDKSGNFKESQSFNAQDIDKLVAVLTKLQQELGKWQDYYRETGKAAPEPRVQTMAEKRDAALAQAQSAPKAHPQDRTQEHAPTQAEPEQ